MPEASDVVRLKERAEKDARKAAEAGGALKEILRTLKHKHGVDSLKDAEKLLKRLEKEAVQAERDFTSALEKYEREYENVLPPTRAETETD